MGGLSGVTLLDLEENQIADLKPLRSLTQLEVLDLQNVPINDLDLGNYLRHLKTVFLGAGGNGLSKGDLQHFIRELSPNCQVKTS